MGFALTQ